MEQRGREYAAEIADYLLGRLTPVHESYSIGRPAATSSTAPILAWWILEGRRYIGYQGNLLANIARIERDIEILIRTYNPTWRGLYVPEGEVDWVATAMQSVISHQPTYVCRSSTIGLGADEKWAIEIWRSWISQMVSDYSEKLGFNLAKFEVLKRWEAKRIDRWQLRKAAHIAKRSRWPLLTHVIAATLRAAIEPLSLEQVPLPTDRSALFELICMVRILRELYPQPNHIRWIDRLSGNNTCTVPGAVYTFQLTFERNAVLDSGEYSPELVRSLQSFGLSIPTRADGLLEFATPRNGFRGILIEAKSGTNRSFEETIPQLKTYIRTLKNEVPGRYLVWGIVESSTPSTSPHPLLDKAIAQSQEEDLWIFSTEKEIPAIVRRIFSCPL